MESEKEESKQQPEATKTSTCCKNNPHKCEAGCEVGQDINPNQDKEGWQEEKSELIATLQRVAADFDNYKKRAAKEKQETEAQAAADLISDLLPVLDNLELALSLDKDSDENSRKGREMIYAILLSTLEKRGLHMIDAMGKPFDPMLHEALLSGPGQQKNQVIEVLQKGYTLNGKTLRTAKVKIST